MKVDELSSQLNSLSGQLKALQLQVDRQKQSQLPIDSDEILSPEAKNSHTAIVEGNTGSGTVLEAQVQLIEKQLTVLGELNAFKKPDAPDTENSSTPDKSLTTENQQDQSSSLQVIYHQLMKDEQYEYQIRELERQLFSLESN